MNILMDVYIPFVLFHADRGVFFVVVSNEFTGAETAW